jgi:hypothetical protein
MSDGSPEPNSDDGGRPKEGPILSPDELDIAEDEHVRQIDEGRYVVSSDTQIDQQSESGENENRQPRQSSQEADRRREPEARSQPSQSPSPDEGSTATGQIDDERVHAWLRESFVESSSRYGFDVTATFDGSISHRRMASNDVVTIFESLMLWYAQQIDSNTPVEEILGILLMESNVPIRYPPKSLRSLLRSTDLEPDDTVADLLAAVDDDDGVKL